MQVESGGSNLESNLARALDLFAKQWALHSSVCFEYTAFRHTCGYARGVPRAFQALLMGFDSPYPLHFASCVGRTELLHSTGGRFDSYMRHQFRSLAQLAEACLLSMETWVQFLQGRPSRTLQTPYGRTSCSY